MWNANVLPIFAKAPNKLAKADADLFGVFSFKVAKTTVWGLHK